ncbi:MAG: hypothetical protein JST47_11640 [Bacteroidetes bacterium]|nr:hypothetical protein [Bacteroidota bacterium]
MKDHVKIGIQNLHLDELNCLKELLARPGIELYTWRKHDFSLAELKSCDVLILFARRHWRYIKYGKPYLLILADYVSDQKAINLTKKRRLGLSGYKYYPNNLFKGFLCGSEELFQTVKSAKIPGVFYPKKYPFSELFKTLQNIVSPEPKEIVTLINDYARTAGKPKWNKPENSFRIFKSITEKVSEFRFAHYGSPHNQKSFDESNKIQFHARYTMHIKYWGHVCNAVVKSLALGTPVIMDEETFKKGRYAAYIKNGENALVFKNKEEIINYLNGQHEQQAWINLKKNCCAEASLWHFPYSPAQKNAIAELLNFIE